MTRADQILQLSLAMKALEQCLDHLAKVPGDDGYRAGMATVAVVTAQVKVHAVLTAMVKEEVEAA